jgi:phospholipid/cholesterol/gamma-HCH transport system permease protein
MLNKVAGKASAPDPLNPKVDCSTEDGVLTISLSGLWNTNRAGRVDAAMREIQSRKGMKAVVIDLSAMSGMDTAGAWLIERMAAEFENSGIEATKTGQTEISEVLLKAVAPAARARHAPPKRRFWLSPTAIFEFVGRGAYTALDDFLMAMNILGATIRGAQLKMGRGHGLNPAAIVNQIDRMGVGALPVIILMSTIIGAIVAQQGAFQLRVFGAEIFVVDLVGILVLREIGVLLTAIMIAGRTGSAITAEIGTMKMREEVDALKVIGLNPVGVLVFPRLVALVVCLPLLTIIADFAAIGGAMFVSYVYSGISPDTFIERLRDAIGLNTYYAGLIKAPFMAIIIGVMAAMEGMKVEGSAESLGRRVTASVVKSIFVVIVVDGLFAMFYAAIDF